MKNTNPCIVLFGGILISCLFSGCTKSIPKPADLPELLPCEITVIQDGKPLSDATVFLSAIDSKTRFTFGGKTDEKGVAKIKTDAQWVGVPLGKYKVSIKRLTNPTTPLPTEIPSDDAGRAEYNKKLAERDREVMNTVDEKFLNPVSSPLTLEVVAGGAKESFDVGAAANKSWSDVGKDSSKSRTGR